MMDGVNFRNLTGSVKQFVVSEQVIADKIACEDDVVDVGDEF